MNKLNIWAAFLSLLITFFCFVPKAVQAVPPTNFQTTQVIGDGLDGPSGFEIAPDGRIFILERAGKVKIYKNGQLLAQPFVDLPSTDTGDRGLIGIAFDPDFHNNHYVYFYYTGVDLLNRLVRFSAATDTATDGPVIIYETTQPSQLLHVGGSIRFGADGKIYFAVGDNGYPPNAQDLSNPHGKILRINRDGTIPSDNPFVGQAGKLPEIWAYGLRNPWRFQFDSVTGNLYGGDVGNYTWEEVNKIVKGGNYGWPNAEGVCQGCPYLNPLYNYNHDNQSSAVTGGPVYRGGLFPTEYNGNYFFGDYARGFIKRIILDQAGNFVSAEDFDNSAGSVVDLKVGPDGSLYYITYYPGRLYKIGYSLGNHSPTANASADIIKGVEPLTVNFSSAGSFDPDGSLLSYLWEFGDGTVSNQANPTKIYNNKGSYTVELTVSDGTFQSQAVPLVIQVGTPPTLTVGSPSDGAKYKAGDTIYYTAFATDGAGFDINDSGISTTILFHHGTHIHPFMGPLLGRAGNFTIPNKDHESSSDTYFEVIVTATDSNGLSTDKSVFIYPQKSNINFLSSIPGLKVLLDGIPVITNSVVNGVVGYIRELSAPLIQEFNGFLYQFNNWTDNGPFKRDIVTQAFDTSYQANFIQIPPFNSEYFDNRNLTGTPVLTRTDNLINFEWFDLSPDPQISVDNFSARFSKSQTFAGGKYKFTTSTDDGVRLYIDGNLLIDKWIDQGTTSYSAEVDLSQGEHTVVMEYYDAGGWATAMLNWEVVSLTNTLPSNIYNIEYFDNKDLSGQPKVTAQNLNVNFNWHEGSPDSQIPNDLFSARFSKTANFEAGTYQFKVLADDGVRIYIDGELVLDKWIDQPPTAFSINKDLSAGNHTIVLEYYENLGGAVVEFSYSKLAGPTPTPTPTPVPQEDPTYQARFWNLPAGFSTPTIPLTAADLTRQDSQINFNLGAGSPDPVINPNNYIASWTRKINFEDGNYEFKTVSDDGIRVYLDNVVVLDKWNDHAATEDKVIQPVTAGLHDVKVEYYEKGGDSVVIFSYTKTSGPVPTPTPTPVPGGFLAEYFNNLTLSGVPILTRNDSVISFKWGVLSPDPILPNDGYSVRWTKTENFEARTYQFKVVADDGVRLYIDGELVLDKWIDQPPTEFIISKDMTAFNHTIVLEYYEKAGEAMAELSY